ncbi:hypothetical protein DB2_54 [Octadecabacter Antarctic DB virus 2]|nr:hypothetical protein DB2_54 [Octadecabacter Antarctic DB virus 2]
MSNCQHCGQGSISRDINGPVCADCVDDGRFDDGSDEPVRPPCISPELFAQIVAELSKYNGAFDASVQVVNINGVNFHRAPF